MKRFPGPCWQLRHRQSWVAGTADMAELAVDTAENIALAQEAHSARPMLKLGSACWQAVEPEVEALAQPAPALSIADKP